MSLRKENHPVNLEFNDLKVDMHIDAKGNQSLKIVALNRESGEYMNLEPYLTASAVNMLKMQLNMQFGNKGTAH